MPNISEYLLAETITEIDIAPWAELVPINVKVIGANCFVDIFLVDPIGAVHMLETPAAAIKQIASSEDEFWRRCVDDEEGWLLRPLMDRCRAAAKSLARGQCYAFTTLPFLGGKYEVENIWVCDLKEWLAFTAHLYVQTRDLPDGTRISLKVVKPH